MSCRTPTECAPSRPAASDTSTHNGVASVVANTRGPTKKAKGSMPMTAAWVASAVAAASVA